MTASKENPQDQLYIFERIMGIRFVDNKVEVLVEWKGKWKSSEKKTWEQLHNFECVDEVLKFCSNAEIYLKEFVAGSSNKYKVFEIIMNEKNQYKVRYIAEKEIRLRNLSSGFIKSASNMLIDVKKI